MKAVIVITLLLLMSCTMQQQEKTPAIPAEQPAMAAPEPALEEPNAFESLGDIEQELDFSELEELNAGLAELEEI